MKRRGFTNRKISGATVVIVTTGFILSAQGALLEPAPKEVGSITAGDVKIIPVLD